MTSSKQTILESIRSHTTEQFACPDLTALEASAVSYPDPVAQFKASLAAAGGRAVELASGQSVGQLVALLYPQATRVANTVANLSGAEALPGQPFNPDTVEQPGQLNGTDVAIIASGLGVAENACCWIADTVRHRAIYFIAEALVIVLSKHHIVSNMHQAYHQLPDPTAAPFGCFISGPSKTADIEQALVFGAHGAREVTVVITDAR